VRSRQQIGCVCAEGCPLEIFGVPTQALAGQIVLGVVNGSFYAILSLGLAVIFGMLNIVNFAHGALFMMGAYVAWLMLQFLHLDFWWSLAVAPIVIGALGIAVERLLLKPLYGLDPIYGLLLTFGLSLVIEGMFRDQFGVSGQSYLAPPSLRGATDLGFMVLPNYRAWAVIFSLVACLATWLMIERTKLGSYLRAATENPVMVRAFGINVPLMITLTYGFGAALAGYAGVLAGPLVQISPLMGSNMVIIVFAVVVIGGMGSILGSIFTGFALGVVEGLIKVYYPEASSTVVFVIMALVLLLYPAGLFGKDAVRR
jgi:branched-chain amino acid transport system permease protein